MITTSYDPEADALYLRLVDKGTRIEQTREVEPGVMLDYAEDGRVIGIEVLGAHARATAA